MLNMTIQYKMLYQYDLVFSPAIIFQERLPNCIIRHSQTRDKGVSLFTHLSFKIQKIIVNIHLSCTASHVKF